MATSTLGMSGQNTYIVLDRTTGRGLFRIDGATEEITCITPTVTWEYAHSVALDKAGNYIVTVDISGAYGKNDGVYRVSPEGAITPVCVGEPLAEPRGLVVDADGNYVVLNEDRQGYAQILKVTPQGGLQLLFQGRPLDCPMDLAIDAQGNYVIADAQTHGYFMGHWSNLYGNGAVYRFNPKTLEIKTVRSSIDENKNATVDSLLGYYTGIAIDEDGNYVMCEAPLDLGTEHNWHTPTVASWITKMTPQGEILNSFGVGEIDNLYSVFLDIEIDQSGDYIVADAVGITSSTSRLVRIKPDGGRTSIAHSSLIGTLGSVQIMGAPKPPPPLKIIEHQFEPGTRKLTLRWETQTGCFYRVDGRWRLETGAWAELTTPILGTGAIAEFHESCSTPSRFYRIVQLVR
jgi:sugar lactone lactonase YvrE